ncbi:MAG: YacL family protein, partial [Alkalimonas sp.]|nr:YacL family protein [Alkalimonas sp.]
MDYEFYYNRDTGNFALNLPLEQDAIARFLLDEFVLDQAGYHLLLRELHGLGNHSSWQYQGRNWSLFVEDGDVLVCHHSLLELEHEPLPDKLAGSQLALDEDNLQGECGLDDLIRLVEQWQVFVAGQRG